MSDREKLADVVAGALNAEPPYVSMAQFTRDGLSWIVYEVAFERNVALSRWATSHAARDEVKRLESKWRAERVIAAAERAGFLIVAPDDGR